MKKLKLDLEELHVDSFTVSDDDLGTGTVEGYISARCTGGGITCDNANTCGGVGDTCEATVCDVSCNGSCPCYPDDPYTDYTCGTLFTQKASCGVCVKSVNDVNTCVAPCTYTCPR